MSAILCTIKISSFLLYTVCITHIYKKKRKERQERTGRALYELSHYLYLGTNQDRLISGSHRDGGGARCYTRHYKPRRSIVSCSSCCSRVPLSPASFGLEADLQTATRLNPAFPYVSGEGALFRLNALTFPPRPASFSSACSGYLLRWKGSRNVRPCVRI